MIRYIRIAFLAVLAICLVTIAMANRNMVTLQLLSETPSTFLGFNWAIELPLFVVVFGGIVVGLLIGFFWEWMREYKIRSEASRQKRENAKLTREVSRLKKRKHGTEDDVLALLEDGSTPG